MNDVPKINGFGAARRPNIKKVKGLETLTSLNKEFWSFFLSDSCCRVSGLQKEVGAKSFFRPTKFLTKNAPNFVPENFRPLLNNFPVNPNLAN